MAHEIYAVCVWIAFPQVVFPRLRKEEGLVRDETAPARFEHGRSYIKVSFQSATGSVGGPRRRQVNVNQINSEVEAWFKRASMPLFAVRSRRGRPLGFPRSRANANRPRTKSQGSVQEIPQQSHTFPAPLLSASHLTLCSPTTMLFSRNHFVALLAIAAVDARPSPLQERDPDTEAYYCGPVNDGWGCNNDSFIPGVCKDLRGSPYDQNVASFSLPSGFFCDLFP